MHIVTIRTILLAGAFVAVSAASAAAAPVRATVEIDRISFAQLANGGGFAVRVHAGEDAPEYELEENGRSLDLSLMGARLSMDFRRDEPRFPVRTYLVSPQRDRVVLHLTLADPMSAEMLREEGSGDLVLALVPHIRTPAAGWGGGVSRPRQTGVRAPARVAPVPAPTAAASLPAERSRESRSRIWPTRRNPVHAPAPAVVPAPSASPTVVSPRTTNTEAAPVVPRSTSDPGELSTNWQLDTVILDAGHGGHDVGATYHGVREKDVTLAITRRLGQMIERELGVNVVYTRDDDRFIELRERGRIANREGGKLFISIHANAAANTSALGTETYFLAPHRSNSARDVMERENSVIELESAPEHYAEYNEDGGDILRAMAMSAYQEESQELASLIEGEFSATRRSRGVKQAGFLVLWAASMPAVLVETGFVSNASEAQLLAGARGQEDTARAIFRAVQAYKERYERGLRVATRNN